MRSVSWSQKQILAALAGGSCVMLLILALVYHRQARKLGELQQEVAENENALQEEQALLQEQGQILAAYQDAQRELSVLEERLIPEEFSATFLRQLEQQAQAVQVRVKSVGYQAQPETPAPPAPAPKEEGKKKEGGEEEPPKTEETKQPTTYPQHRFQLVLTGDYEHLLQFLARLPQFPKPFEIQSMELRSVETEEEKKLGYLNASLGVVVYEMDRGLGSPQEDGRPTPPVQQNVASIAEEANNYD